MPKESDTPSKVDPIIAAQARVDAAERALHDAVLVGGGKEAAVDAAAAEVDAARAALAKLAVK